MSLISESKGVFCPTKAYTFQEINPLEHTAVGVVETGSSLKETKYSVSIETRKTNGSEIRFRDKIGQSLSRPITRIFIPRGYPQSVSEDYLFYQIWLCIQNLCSSIAEAIAEESIMKAIGVGSSTATALAAASTVLIRNGTSRVSEIFFASIIGSFLDYNHKKWKFMGDLAVNIGAVLNMVSRFFEPSTAIFVLCASTFVYAFVGLVAGCTRIAFIQRQARMSNTGDVVAKDRSQEMIVDLTAVGISLAILPVLSERPVIAWSVFGSLCCLHITANYIALRSLRIETFNNDRLLICLKQFLKTRTVPSVRKANAQESLIVGMGIKDTDLGDYKIRMGVSVEEAINTKSNKSIFVNFPELLQTFAGKRFIIIPNHDKKKINVIIHADKQPLDLIEAYCRSVFVSSRKLKNTLNPMDSEITNDWESFVKCIEEAKYITSDAFLKCGEWRSQWEV